MNRAQKNFVVAIVILTLSLSLGTLTLQAASDEKLNETVFSGDLQSVKRFA